MKRILLILLAIFVIHSLSAKKIFVEMEFHKNCIKLDDGTTQKSQPLKADDGNDLKFNSLIGAMNYMSLQGWELVETKSVTSGGGYGGISATDTKVYYIYCREVSDEELLQVVDNSYKK